MKYVKIGRVNSTPQEMHITNIATIEDCLIAADIMLEHNEKVYENHICKDRNSIPVDRAILIVKSQKKGEQMNEKTSYMKIRMDNDEDRFVPQFVYDRVEAGVNNLRENSKKFPKPIRWLVNKAVKDLDLKEHIEISLRGLINSVEELGGDIIWREKT